VVGEGVKLASRVLQLTGLNCEYVQGNLCCQSRSTARNEGIDKRDLSPRFLVSSKREQRKKNGPIFQFQFLLSIFIFYFSFVISAICQFSIFNLEIRTWGFGFVIWNLQSEIWNLKFWI